MKIVSKAITRFIVHISKNATFICGYIATYKHKQKEIIIPNKVLNAYSCVIHSYINLYEDN